MHVDLIGLTLGASLDVVFNIFLQFRPPIGSCDQVFCPRYSWVSGHWWIMEFLYNSPSFHHVSCYHQSSFFIPFSSKLLKPMCIHPFLYCRHLLSIEQFFDSQTANEQGVWEDGDVLIIPHSLIIIWASG